MKILEIIANCFKQKEPEYKKVLKTYEIKDSEEESEKERIGDWNLEFLMSLEWKRYEEVCKEFLTIKENGNKINLTKKGADGGIDLKINDKKDNLIGVGQCKAYNSKITIEKIRELYGIMASEKVEKGYFFTTSSFTKDAIEFAKNQNIDLIDGEKLIKTVSYFTEEQQNKLYEMAIEGDYTTPTCARCDVKMVKRESKNGTFWGCKNFPKCKNILQVRKNTAG